MKAMQTGVRTSQEISQKILNGRPKMMGFTRSHSETEKHTATNGASARSIAGTESLRT